jgi:hypothetical protein
MCVLVGVEPMARSSAGLTVKLGTGIREQGSGIRDIAGRVVRARTSVREETLVAFSAAACTHD